MSIVINLLFRDYSILVSDTRAMGRDKDGNSVIASENFQKIFSVSKRLAYGYTGCAPFAAALSEQVGRLAPLECMYSDQLARFLHGQIHSLLPKYREPVQVVVTGIRSDATMASYTILPQTDYQLTEHTVDRTPRVLNLCDTPFTEVLNPKLDEILTSSTPNKLAAVRQCLVDHVAYVAARNQTVNSRAKVINIPLAQSIHCT